MSKAIKLSTDGTISLLDVPEERDFHWFAQQIGCDYIEIVYPRDLEEGYQMIVDEEGLYKETPRLNFIGAWLYGMQDHGNPIVGDALIMKTAYTEDGIDTDGLPEDEAEKLAGNLREMLLPAYLALRSRCAQ